MSTIEEQSISSAPSTNPEGSLVSIAAIAFGLVIAIYFFCCRSSKGTKSRRNARTVFLLGECGSGKTSLLYYLHTKNVPKTTSSIQQNEANLEIKGDSKDITVPFVDVPGHHHLRNIFFDRIIETKAIVLVIDASDKTQIPGTADFLYKILVNPVFRENDIPILIALNKQDLANARKIPLIEEELANEIEKLKTSKRAIQEDNDDEDFLKQDFQKFNFSSFDIKFAEISPQTDRVTDVHKFLSNAFDL